jgi:hypothetical protein
MLQKGCNFELLSSIKFQFEGGMLCLEKVRVLTNPNSVEGQVKCRCEEAKEV